MPGNAVSFGRGRSCQRVSGEAILHSFLYEPRSRKTIPTPRNPEPGASENRLVQGCFEILTLAALH